MGILAVGDLQGCYDPFRRLLDAARFDPLVDRLWLVGDLVNRGPQNLETLRFVKNLGDAAVTVLGNHDLYLLMMAEGQGKRGKDDTLDDVLTAPDRDELLWWLRQQPLMHLETVGGREYGMVHAGLLPGWTAKQARGLAAEVEAQLQGDNWRALMANLWGSEPVGWRDDLVSWARYRVIVNAMTRMRFVTPTGDMEFKTKGELRDAPAGHFPWFDAPGRVEQTSTIVCGHWSALGLVIRPGLLALDSGCLWGRELSAVWLPGHEVVQVDCGCGEGK